MMPLVADVIADVVQERRKLQPFALAIAEAVDVARLVEQGQRQPRHLPRVFRLPVAALGELDGRAAPHVGIAIDAGDFLPVLLDVVEHQPFAQRQVAQRDFAGIELSQQRVERAPRRRP